MRKSSSIEVQYVSAMGKFGTNERSHKFRTLGVFAFRLLGVSGRVFE